MTDILADVLKMLATLRSNTRYSAPFVYRGEGEAMIPREPTADECSNHAYLGRGWYAIWYPQMSGYVGKAAVLIDMGDNNSCFDIYVWHDGEFPFSDDRNDASYEETAHSRQMPPIHLHHCDAEQFIYFGETIIKLQEEKQCREPS